MKRHWYTILGLSLIALYLSEIAVTAATWGRPDPFTFILYLFQLVCWVGATMLWKAKADRLEKEGS